MKIVVGKFVQRQTRTSEFGYFNGDWDTLRGIVQYTVDNIPEAIKKGYRDGVNLVSVDPIGFFTSIVKMDNTIVTETVFKKRQEHEEPVRKSIAYGIKKPAVRVEIVLYDRNVLVEDKMYVPTSEEDYTEIVSINCSPYEYETPMTPITMARNFLEKSGGTKGNFTAEQFANSIWFWNEHVMICEK